MSGLPDSFLPTPPAAADALDEACDHFAVEWESGRQPRIEDYLARLGEGDRVPFLEALLAIELKNRWAAGEAPELAQYRGRFPQYQRPVWAVFQMERRAAGGRGSAIPRPSGEPDPDDIPTGSVRGLASIPPPAGPNSGGLWFGRYRVVQPLGEGQFGVVYRAHDDELDRPVAIKVPHANRIRGPADVKAYLDEARVLARLRHPNIVAVHDLDRTPEGVPFIVSEFVEGGDLNALLAKARPGFQTSARIVAAVAEALHYAHTNGVVHRDVKPANLLVGTAGKAYVADFGVALKEEDFGRGAKFVGTPAYMSPEQARGEGHRVDGRSDVFSLGVVLYELLTARRPFRGDTWDELKEQLLSVEARPPRQVDDAIPAELERICLKALSKAISQRYTTAKDLADDLRYFLDAGDPTRPPYHPLTYPVAVATLAPLATAPAPTTANRPSGLVPKGLRSFDAGDAGFFLELLPGPRDRDGLPETVRFWKAQVEEKDPDRAFSVGLIYGPSGCGKSSVVKAGLLPRLSDSLTVVHLDATAADTEGRLLAVLRKACPGLSAGHGLAGAMASLRRGTGLPAGGKVLIVLDQFEQWLHGRHEGGNELVVALRQCDGGRVQGLLLVRDDFWMAVSRFMRELDVPIREGENSAAVDLFDARHARKVLTMFGQAFGALPERVTSMTAGNAAFLDQAVIALSQDGRVSPVRLAVFAEMVKGRPWEPATLKALGGMEGVGVTFLRESFDAPTAPPARRAHQRAAREVLAALLPEPGSDIKGTMRGRGELMAAAGYSSRPGDFDELIRILDKELRLVSPSDPEGVDRGSAGGERLYQLTHDFLVPSLREWLTLKQKETRRGRAELRLADRAALWTARPENRHLPRWSEWARIRLFTRPRAWTVPQRRMMRRADRLYAVRGTVLGLAIALAVWAGWEYHGRMKAQALRDRLENAATAEVPVILKDLAPYRRWAGPRLRDGLEAAQSNGDHKKQLHFRLALLADDPQQVEVLYERMLSAEPDEFVVIRTELLPYQGDLTERLWGELDSRQSGIERRFRAACALATFAPLDSRWERYNAEVASKLVVESPLVLRHWMEALGGISDRLLPPLAAFLEDEGREDAQRRTIAHVCRAYSDGRPEAFGPLIQRVRGPVEAFGRPTESDTTPQKRQANLASALVAMGQEDSVWPLLKHSPDPTLRTYLIDGLPRVAQAGVLKNRYEKETDPTSRRALLLSLGGFDSNRLPVDERDRLTPWLITLYRDEPDPGIHSAAGWLLRHWEQSDGLMKIDRELASGHPRDNRSWYVNRQYQTYVIVPEAARPPDPNVAPRLLVAAREVTVDEFLKFREGHKFDSKRVSTRLCPINSVTWYDAVAYCNWLSQNEGMPKEEWCYRPNEKGEYGEGMTIEPDFMRREGYRLPLSWEWELAARAGAQTQLSCGNVDDDTLAQYAWYYHNTHSSGVQRSGPVGLLKPNDHGLFDVHGNVFEWCHDEHPITIQEGVSPTHVFRANRNRHVRGGSYAQRATGLRISHTNGSLPMYGDTNFGFRPVRRLR